jgi:hypothetical protein
LPVPTSTFPTISTGYITNVRDRRKGRFVRSFYSSNDEPIALAPIFELEDGILPASGAHLHLPASIDHADYAVAIAAVGCAKAVVAAAVKARTIELAFLNKLAPVTGRHLLSGRFKLCL